MKKNIIHAANINFYYGQQQILENIHFSVMEKEFVVLSGDNGSGKSTLLKIILGQLVPNTGGVQIFGTPIANFKDYGSLGYLAQDEHSSIVGFPANVLEIVSSNLYSAIGRFRLPSKKDKQIALRVLEQVDMTDYAYAMPKELSGGQLQRVLLAKALISNPRLLILDEPTNSMDEHSVDALYHLFSQLNQRGITFLVISHDVKGISPIATRVYHLESKHLNIIAGRE